MGKAILERTESKGADSGSPSQSAIAQRRLLRSIVICTSTNDTIWNSQRADIYQLLEGCQLDFSISDQRWLMLSSYVSSSSDKQQSEYDSLLLNRGGDEGL